MKTIFNQIVEKVFSTSEKRTMAVLIIVSLMFFGQMAFRLFLK